MDAHPPIFSTELFSFSTSKQPRQYFSFKLQGAFSEVCAESFMDSMFSYYTSGVSASYGVVLAHGDRRGRGGFGMQHHMIQ